MVHLAQSIARFEYSPVGDGITVHKYYPTSKHSLNMLHHEAVEEAGSKKRKWDSFPGIHAACLERPIKNLPILSTSL